ncbi:hypothetical protein CRUP_021751, partial [Coryphaenoides rupestris]
TFRVSPEDESECRPPQRDTPLQPPVFIPIGYYIVVYLAGRFLHCINSRQPETLCHSLFLSGPEAQLGLPEPSSRITVLGVEEESKEGGEGGGRGRGRGGGGGGEGGGGACVTVLLDLATGNIYCVDLSSAYLLQILRADTPPATKL